MPAFHAGDSDSNSGISIPFMFSNVFLENSTYVDYTHPLIQSKAGELFAGLSDADKIEAAYLFVRD